MNINKNKLWLACSIFGLTSLFACDKNGNLNLISLEQDKQLGIQVSQEIEADKNTYPILDEQSNPRPYAYLRRMRDDILNSGKIVYKDDFVWQVKIISDDNTLNAFCTPGGYIYVYTGLIKYLDTKDQLAGVLGHEMGHADLRHTSRNITREYGYDIVQQVLLGDNAATLVKIGRGIGTLSNSRAFEREADDASVTYLSALPAYQCTGAAGFFVKLNAQGGQSPPQWLSTHPNPENRVEAINKKADELKCNKTENPAVTEYQQFKNMLP